MIAKIVRGSGFLGCLNYVLRTRKEDKDVYDTSPGVKSVGKIKVLAPDMPSAPTVVRIFWMGAYRGTIIDHGNSISLTHCFSDKMAAEIAAQKGWKTVRLSGTDDFILYGFEYLLARGMEPSPANKHQEEILNAVIKTRRETGRDHWREITTPNPPELLKPAAPQRVGGGMNGSSAKELSGEFAKSRRARPDVQRPVWHMAVSLAPGEFLNPTQWEKLASKFMKKMGFSDDHQYIAVRHFDKPEDHIHIVASKISLSGNLWTMILIAAGKTYCGELNHPC
jgi:hypothetical protein